MSALFGGGPSSRASAAASTTAPRIIADHPGLTGVRSSASAPAHGQQRRGADSCLKHQPLTTREPRVAASIDASAPVSVATQQIIHTIKGYTSMIAAPASAGRPSTHHLWTAFGPAPFVLHHLLLDDLTSSGRSCSPLTSDEAASPR